MKKLAVIFIALVTLLAFAGASAAYADELNTSAIAGTWYGNMVFPDKTNQRITVNINNCTPGNACGTVYNYVVRCTWELTFDGMQGSAYVFHHSSTLAGGCPAQGTSYYTLQSDGSLLRVHVNPQFTVEGVLSQRPNAGN